jgi:hypothetical protein
MNNKSDEKDPDTTYDKIKHLVEVDDDILAVFSIASTKLNELYIAKNSNIDKTYIDSLIDIFELNQTTNNETLLKITTKEQEEKRILGELRWIVTEYENIRILKIHESTKTIFVLIRSNTSLQNTVDNILGYYYDLDEMPKSLF